MKKLLLSGLALFSLISCKEKPIKYETKQTIINGKAIIAHNCVLSFSNGESEYCSFGEYTKYKVGDTICWQRENGFFNTWYVVDCH